MHFYQNLGRLREASRWGGNVTECGGYISLRLTGKGTAHTNAEPCSMVDGEAHPRTSISFSLKHVQTKSNQAKRRVLIDEDADEPETGASADIPLSGKRKRDVPAPLPPKVIPLASGTDWREERKRRLGILDNHPIRQGSPSASLSHPHGPERAFDEPQKQGLVIVPPNQHQNFIREDTPTQTIITPGDVTPPAIHTSEQEATFTQTSAVPPSDDDAIRALLSNEPSSRVGQAKLVIQQPSEEDMFHHDVDSRPDEPSLKDYATMPVEEFGAAMLRGMGWQDGSGIGRDQKGPIHAPMVQRRAALLGLGAKERAVPSTSSRKPNDQRYIPVVSRSDSARDSTNRTHSRSEPTRSEYRHASSSNRHGEAHRSARHHKDHSRSSDRSPSSHSSRYDDRHRSHSRRHE